MNSTFNVEKLTSRYGDPGFHRHVDAAKILGLLCMSLPST